MTVNFSQPQRQSSVGILVLFVTTFQQYVRALWPIVLVWIFKYETLNKFYFFGVIGISVVLLGVISFLKYLNFTFYIDEASREFIIEEGIIKKTKTAIQLHKIQQVAINQSLIQRIIGVFELNVDTAGSAQNEVKIKAISHELAIALKVKLLENDFNFSGVSQELNEISIESEKPVLNTSFMTLLKVGLTSNYLKSFSLLLLFVITLFDYFEKITGNKVVKEEQLDSYVTSNRMMSIVISMLFFLFIIVLVINVIRIVVNYFNYSIAKQNSSLLISYGLFHSKSTILKPERVQMVTIIQNYFQKKLNISEMKITQAIGGEREQQKTGIDIPGCNYHEQNDILNLLFDQIPKKGAELRPSNRLLIISILTKIILPLSAFLILENYFFPVLGYYYFILPIYVFFIVGYLYFDFKQYRLFVTPEFIIKRSGAWDISNQIIEIKRIQALTTSQLFWHKKANVGTLKIHTAGGTIIFKIGNFTKINQYVNLWLYKVEISDSNWM